MTLRLPSGIPEPCAGWLCPSSWVTGNPARDSATQSLHIKPQPRTSDICLCHCDLQDLSRSRHRTQGFSQWRGRRGLHQDEVLECLTMEESWQVSHNKVDCELTTVFTPSTLLNHSRSQMDGTLSDDHTKPLLAHTLAAFKGNGSSNDPSKSSIVWVPAALEDYESEDDSSSSATLVAPSKVTSHSVDSHQSKRVPLITLNWSSLPNHESYAQRIYSTLNYSVLEEPPPAETSSLERRTLAFGTPGNIQPCIYPDSQLALFKQGARQQTLHPPYLWVQ